MSGLEDNQVLGLYHSLMREDRSHDYETHPRLMPVQDEHDQIIDAVESRFERGELTMNTGSHHPARRLAAARLETPESARLYAARRIIGRAQRGARAQRNYLQSYARELGATETAAAYEYWNAFAEASDNAQLQPSSAFARAWRSNPDHTDLPLDRRSVYAFEQMEIARATRNLGAETRPAVTRHPITNSAAIAEMGYDREGGRIEIVMHSSSRVYAYRMNETEYENFVASTSLGAYYARNIRGNSDYQYASVEDAAEAAVHRRCATCGRWAAMSSHDCPVTSSDEDLNRDIREAVLRARARASATPTNPLPDIPQPVRIPATNTVRYTKDNAGSMRIRGITRLRQDARINSTIETPVEATFVIENGESAVVTGHLMIEYNGRGLGYDVTPVTELGDSREDNLRCSCPLYQRNYHCEHVDGTVDHVRNLMIGETELRNRRAATTAVDSVTATVSAETLSAQLEVDAARATFVPREVSFTDDPEKFQELYTSARESRRIYKNALAAGINSEDLEYPVPFVKTAGALGGLYTRESGQGFGTEIEYSFPQTMSREDQRLANRQIGQALYAAGLTDSSRQKEYGATHYTTPSTEHAQGWSFEEDPSTGGRDYLQGGEIISPIMYDEAETWENVEKVCKILKENGAIPSKGAGAHVHVGAGEYDHNVANYNRILAAYGENEDLLYRLSTNPEARAHRPYHPYCGPNNLPSTPYTEIGTASSAHNSHGVAINFQSMRGQETSDNVEFRLFDATLNPGVLQTQIMIATSITAAASRESGNPRPNAQKTSVGTALEGNPQREPLTGDAWNAQTKSVRAFIDRFISGTGADGGAVRAKQIATLFAINRWQRSIQR